MVVVEVELTEFLGQGLIMSGSPSWPAGVVQHIKASRLTPVLVSDVLPSICVIPAGHVAVRQSLCIILGTSVDNGSSKDSSGSEEAAHCLCLFYTILGVFEEGSC